MVCQSDKQGPEASVQLPVLSAVLRARTPSPAPPWSHCFSCPPPAAKNPVGAPSLQQPGLAFLELFFK